MSNAYLRNAFKMLDALNEDVFDVSDEGISQLADTLNTEDNTVNIIDPEAESEEDIQDSYMGKAILECEVCHSLIYKNKDEIKIDDESQLANIDEECPYCFSTNGYKIVGQVEPFEEESEDDDVDVEVDGEDVDIESEEEDDDEDVESKKDGGDLDESLKEDMKNFYDTETFNDYINNNLLDDVDYYISKCSLDDRPYIKVFYSAGIRSWIATIKFISKTINTFLWRADYFPLDNHATFEINNTVDAINNKLNKKYNTSVVKSNKTVKIFLNTMDEDDVNESLKEGFNDVQITTDDQHLTMTQDSETGKVTVETEPIQQEESFESEDMMIAPLNDEEEQEIEDNSDQLEAEEESEEVPEDETSEEPEEEESEDIDISDFEESLFNDLGQKYLTEVYDNIESFNTSNVYQDNKNNKLIIEGVIKFTSGNSKKTSFIFEAKDIDKDRKVRFVGENQQITKGKKSFTLRGTLKEGKLLSESLTYNYRTRDNDGESIRLYNTIKVEK